MGRYRMSDLLIDAMELIDGMYDISDETLVDCIMKIIGDKVDLFIKMNNIDRFDFLCDGMDSLGF